MSRREMIVAGAAYLCGCPALARAADLSIDSLLNEVRTHLVGRSGDVPQIDTANRMTADALYKAVQQKSAYGTTNKGRVYVLAFEPDGKGLLQIENDPLETGKWWISTDAHTIQSQWPSAADGDVLEMYYQQFDDDLFAARTLDGRRSSYFFIGETPPEMRGR